MQGSIENELKQITFYLGIPNSKKSMTHKRNRSVPHYKKTNPSLSMQEYWLTIGPSILYEHSFSLRKRQIRFQTKMEDLSVEVYGDNGAYYKVCKL